MPPEPFEKEMAHFEEHRGEFLQHAEGKFVLIKEEKNYGFFDTAESAYKAGMDLFGVQPFLIKQVLAEDRIQEIPAYCLGLTHASI